MFDNAQTVTLHPLFLGHDLLIELGRLQVAIEDRGRDPANDAARQSLATQRALLAAAFDRLNGNDDPSH